MPRLVHPLRVPIDETLNVYRLSLRRRGRRDSVGLPVPVDYRIDPMHVARRTRGRGACEAERRGAKTLFVREESAAIGDIVEDATVLLGIHGERGYTVNLDKRRNT